jgi:hypothetical protein
MMTNQGIYKEDHSAGIHLWQIAKRYDLNDGRFPRKLHHELHDTGKVKIRPIIDDITNGGRET